MMRFVISQNADFLRLNMVLYVKMRRTRILANEIAVMTAARMQ